MVPMASARYKSCVQRWCHSDLLASSIGWDATGLKQQGDHFLSFWSGFGGLVIKVWSWHGEKCTKEHSHLFCFFYFILFVLSLFI